MKHKIAVYFAAFMLFGFLLAAVDATAQSIAYRQTNLASNLPATANNVNRNLVDPWGIAFLPGQTFFIADHAVGRVTSHDATGAGFAPASFTVPNATGTGFAHPTGIVADQNSSFGGPSLVKPLIIVSDEGAIFTWGPDARGDLPQAATLAANDASTGAVYKGVTILNSSLTAPALAVTDFHGGLIHTFLPGFAPVALPGSFSDPHLPPGFAPFGIQVIGTQVFVTYALQDALKHDPILGEGNGIVNIFDMDGNIVRRFATGGALNAPWGIAQASANFGPFSNDILIGNIGDGTINAFDLATGNFVGKLEDSDGHAIVHVGLHGLALRADGFGDPNTLYFTSEFSNEQDGLFGTITTGLVSLTRVSAPDTPSNTSARISATIAAAPGNSGIPTGTVIFLDDKNQLGAARLVNGLAALDAILTDIRNHNITAQYTGDRVFLPSSNTATVQVTGLATTTRLAVPANAAPGSSVVFTATTTSADGIPTGQIVFHDGTTDLGTVSLDGAGVAILRNDTLLVGAHSLTATYSGDAKFGGSTSAAATITVANADFSLAATPSSATVIAGQSTQFMLSLTPAGGFANNVTFSCSPVAGITCSFNPATLTPANGSASTTLTVTTSASVSRYGLLTPDLIGSYSLLAALGLFCFLISRGAKLRIVRPSLLTTTALVLGGLGFVMAGCGGYGSATQANRGTASVVVTAQSGNISHTTTVNVTVQ